MERDGIGQLTGALTLSRAALASGFEFTFANQFQRAAVGLAWLAQSHGDTLLWALREGNVPAAMAAIRILTELQINLLYLRHRPEYREYRACLLLMENYTRNLAILDPEHQADFVLELPGREALLDSLRQERQVMQTYMDSLPRDPADPAAWTELGPVWLHLPDVRLPSFYAFGFTAASGFIHSDGYAINELLMGHKNALSPSVAAMCADFIGNAISCLLDEWPDLASPEMEQVWEEFVTLSAAS